MLLSSKFPFLLSVSLLLIVTVVFTTSFFTSAKSNPSDMIVENDDDYNSNNNKQFASSSSSDTLENINDHFLVINDVLPQKERIRSPANMNPAKSIEENTRLYYKDLHKGIRKDRQRQRERDRKYYAYSRDHPENTDFVEDELHRADEIWTINNKTVDTCKIHCPRCHRWSSMGESCVAFGRLPTREEAEECLWHFYHPRELKQDKFRFDLISSQLDKIGKKHTSGGIMMKRKIFLLAGDNGVGKTHLIQVLSLLNSAYYYHEGQHKSVFYEKGDVLLELDCGTFESMNGGWPAIYRWVTSAIENHVKKFDRPFIVFNDLQKCEKRTIEKIVIPLFTSVDTQMPLFETPGLHLPAATSMFATMDMGKAGATQHLSLREIHSVVTKKVIDRFGNSFEKLVSIYPFEPWKEDTYLWALKRALDNVPCMVHSKVRKISYTKMALGWYAGEMYALEGTEINNGRKAAEYFAHEIETRINQEVQKYEKNKVLSANAGRRSGADREDGGTGWFGKAFSSMTTTVKRVVTGKRGYTVIIEWIPFAHTRPKITVVEEGQSEEETNEEL